MRKLLHSLLLILALAAPAYGQDKKEPEPPPNAPSQLLPYSLAAVGALVAILLVCAPVRRN